MKIADIKRELGLENINLEDINRIKFQLQKLNDTIKGGIRSANLKEYRNTYVINAQDSLDASYPMYTHFNIISEITKIVSIKLSFWFLNFRAYSTAAASGGGSTPTSSSGGGQTTSSGGGQTSSTNSGAYVRAFSAIALVGVVTGIGDQSQSGHIITSYTLGTGAPHEHTHTVANHDHTIANHDHTVTIVAHIHDITYGIFEDSTSPTVMVYISKDNGLTYSLPIGSYTEDQENIDITSMINTVGSKMIRFTTDARTRLSVQIEIKLDIKAR